MFERIVEQVANRILSMDPDTATRLSRLQGKRVALTLQGTPLPVLVFEFDLEGVRVERERDEELPAGADVRLAAPPVTLLRAVTGGDLRDPASVGINVSGDADVAQDLAELVTALDVDWEDEIALRVGDIPARVLGRIIAGGQRWREQAGNAVRDNVGEFLREESGELVTARDINRFLDDVDAIRNHSDSIEERIRRLEQRHAPGAAS